MKNDAASRAGRALGELANEMLDKTSRRMSRMDTILDAYIRSGVTGRPYQEERDKMLRKRGLGTIDD